MRLGFLMTSDLALFSWSTTEGWSVNSVPTLPHIFIRFPFLGCSSCSPIFANFCCETTLFSVPVSRYTHAVPRLTFLQFWRIIHNACLPESADSF
ncbi:hypothetical protein BJ741DRAFT_589833 [Chytriomyces cf. hyalinus JEL632]|nr:hypothetical protein BJ741DRAFT_589833 [Chytriomyces cf. hyalinus JEL632]